MPRKIFLMRHAAPENPRDKMYGWLPGFPLSELGKQQAQEAGEFMAMHPLDIVVTSDLERAAQTGEIVAGLNPNHPELIQDPGLRDVEVKAWEGKNTFKSWRANRMMWWQKQLLGEDGVEKPIATQARVVEVFQNFLHKYPDKNILFVFHGDPLAFLIESLLGKELSPDPHPEIGPIRKANIWEIRLNPVKIEKIFEPTVK